MALSTKFVGLITSKKRRRKKSHLWYIARVQEMKSYYKTLSGQNFKETRDEGEDLRHRYLVGEKIISKWILKKLFLYMGAGFNGLMLRPAGGFC